MPWHRYGERKKDRLLMPCKTLYKEYWCAGEDIKGEVVKCPCPLLLA